MKRLLVICIAAVPLLALGGYGIAQAGERSDVGGAATANARFHNLDAAQQAGYTFHLPELSGKTCISNGSVGAMGDHFVNTSLLDEKLDPAHPEALVYATKPGGGFRLAALEYVVFKGAWEDAHGANAEAPKLFGTTFDLIPSPNRFGLPDFYALHAWLWDRNPSGLFFAWNPKVTCPQ
jgi:hypothetical protein